MTTTDPLTFDSMEYDLVIVGAGIVGATLASLLARNTETANIKIAVIEGAQEPEEFTGSCFDPRVVALSKESQGILEQAGAWEAVVASRVCFYQNMHVWDAEGTGQIDFDCRDNHQTQLGAIVENSVLVRELNRQLKNAKNIDVFQPQKVESIELVEDGLQKVVLEGGVVIQTPVIVAADGGKSSLRAMAGLSTREWEYGHSAIVTTITTERSHEFAAWQRFSQNGPLAYLPLTETGEDSQTCSVVWSQKTGVAESIMAMDDETFCRAIGDALENRLGKVTSTDQRYCIPLTQRHSKTYIKPGFALVGDAAHTIHPLAGQGVNLGLYDVQVLAQEMVRAQERQIPLSHFSILKRYERQRQGHNLVAMATMEGFKQLFGSDNLALRWARNTGMRFMNRQFFIKKQLTKVASGQF